MSTPCSCASVSRAMMKRAWRASRGSPGRGITGWPKTTFRGRGLRVAMKYGCECGEVRCGRGRARSVDRPCEGHEHAGMSQGATDTSIRYACPLNP
jgi:hypothetical protein